jgi:hypothetical protein
MNERPLFSFRMFLPAMLFLVIVGWGGLAALVIFSEPMVWARWGGFVLLTLALVGTTLPLVYFLNRRFPGEKPATPRIILRQAIWVGVYGTTVVWMWHVLTLPLALGMAAGFFIIESLIRMAERSSWRPPVSPEAEGDTALESAPRPRATDPDAGDAPQSTPPDGDSKKS